MEGRRILQKNKKRHTNAGSLQSVSPWAWSKDFKLNILQQISAVSFSELLLPVEGLFCDFG
jgi:hypothetical protein